MASLRGVEALQKELLRAQAKLKDVDEKIKKHTGQDPSERNLRQGGPRRRSLEDARYGASYPAVSRRGRLSTEGPIGGRLFNIARRGLGGEEDAPPAKRRAMGNAFSRLGERVTSGDGRVDRMAMSFGRGGRARGTGIRPSVRGRIVMRTGRDGRRHVEEEEEEDDNEQKPVLSSSVVTPGSKSREEALQEQGKDERGKARNRRMFGALLGTLQRFATEEKSTYSTKEKARHDVEQKLEEKAREEKEEIKRERRGLYEERKKKQMKLKQLEQKMELVKIHDDWVHQTKILMNFIRTKAKPYIFYLPKTHTSNSKKKLKNSQEILEDVIEARRQAMEEELVVIASREDEEDEAHKQQNLDESRDHGDAEEVEQEDMDHNVEVGQETDSTDNIRVKTEPLDEDIEQGEELKDKNENDADHGELDYEHEEDEEMQSAVPVNRNIIDKEESVPESEAQDTRLVQGSNIENGTIENVEMASDHEQHSSNRDNDDAEEKVKQSSDNEKENDENVHSHSSKRRKSRESKDDNEMVSERKSKKSKKEKKEKKHKRRKRSVEVEDRVSDNEPTEKDKRHRKVELKDEDQDNEKDEGDSRKVIKEEDME